MKTNFLWFLFPVEKKLVAKLNVHSLYLSWLNYILYTCISFDLLSVLVLYCSLILQVFFYLDRVMGLIDLCEVSIYLNKHLFLSEISIQRLSHCQYANGMSIVDYFIINIYAVLKQLLLHVQVFLFLNNWFSILLFPYLCSFLQ